MSAQSKDISVVIPTYNRASALRTNFPYVLALEDVAEIVVVIDASTDDTDETLASFADERVRVIRHARRQGSQAARTTAISEARGDWLIMLDDDCAVLPDFARVLLETALRLDADVVSAPWIHIDQQTDLKMAYTRARARANSARLGLNTTHAFFPEDDLETPFMPPNALINRRVFERVRHDEGFTGNAWREETAFFLDARAAGFRCILTPRTASFQLGQWSGGQRLPRLRYEWLAMRNNWKFLRRYAGQLRELGEINHPVTAQLRFAASRVRTVGQGWLRARLASD